MRRLGFVLLYLLWPIAVSKAAWSEDNTESLQILDLTEPEYQSLALDGYRWLNRLIVVFSDSPNDPRFSEQTELLLLRPGELLERDIIVLTDTDPSADSHLRRQLRPRGFVVLVIGKDGGVKLRKPIPWSVREISRAIDKMPLRQREIQTN